MRMISLRIPYIRCWKVNRRCLKHTLYISHTEKGTADAVCSHMSRTTQVGKRIADAMYTTGEQNDKGGHQSKSEFTHQWLALY